MGVIISMWVTMVVMVLLAVGALHAQAIDIPKLRDIAAKSNMTSLYVFGDSAEAIGYTKVVRPFLDPSIQKVDLLHGVSFASGGSGYDDLTANFSQVLSFGHQLEYFKNYKVKLTQLVGDKQAAEIVKNGLYIVHMGTNDFLENYFVEPTRSEQFTVEQYQTYLISCMSRYIQAMHELGARRLVVVGLQALGCIPLVKTLKDTTECDPTYNSVAFSFNTKMKKKLATLTASLGMKHIFVDAYSITANVIKNPTRYGFKVTSKGCCGTGTVEFGPTCRGLSTCANRTEYMFWDAVHPTEKMHKIIADEAIRGFSSTGLV
ncbi:hypothetical protein RJ639_027741 [Escallonia herrerae]|uniref:GDSL esterase/lipase n=1 Tax=Escallonia herrerae TaxID=1293975 RepID=A0AA88X4R6_9ASTE|nr:hypothetical protein RJ639_027741 [Escallonia herrerae]